jgi:hypothetical protein
MGACIYCGDVHLDPHDFECAYCGLINCKCPQCVRCRSVEGECTCHRCDACLDKLQPDEVWDDVCARCLKGGKNEK